MELNKTTKFKTYDYNLPIYNVSVFQKQCMFKYAPILPYLSFIDVYIFSIKNLPIDMGHLKA